MKLTKEELQKKKEQEIEKKLFARKIEEDRLGISRKKQKRVMSFMSYRVIKLILLFVTGVMLFVYTPAILPLTIAIALMMIATKRVEKEKNKNVNKKYRIKIRAADSVIAILLITLTFGVTAYSLITAYTNGGSLTNSAAIEERLADAGYTQAQIEVAQSRMTEGNSYEQILKDAMTLLTGDRNSFDSGRRGFVGVEIGVARPINLEDMDGARPVMKRPNILQLMRNMPLEILFEQLFQMICSVMVGIMILAGAVNVIETFKYGEIKKVTLGRKYAVNKDINSVCPCGSGKKIKKCNCIQSKYYTEFH